MQGWSIPPNAFLPRINENETGTAMRYLLIASILTLVTIEAHAESECERRCQEQLETDLSLSYQAFDQTMDGGFRTLANAGCQKEAADLIEAYIEATGARQSSLRWHIAQLRASHGAEQEAIEYARASLTDNEDLLEHPLRWNDYVLATIAFLEKDREALKKHRDRVAEGVDEHRGNVMNLRLLDALSEHFEASYAEAMQSLVR